MDFLVSAFALDELHRFLATTFGSELVVDLPPAASPPRYYAFKAVAALIARSLIDNAFFAALAAQLPARIDELELLQAAFK